jgi:hypothetical protein
MLVMRYTQSFWGIKMKPRPTEASVPGYSRHSDEQREKNWMTFFKNVHLTSRSPWSETSIVTCIVSMVIYHYDDDMIEKAAKKYGFKTYFKSKGNIGYFRDVEENK